MPIVPSGNWSIAGVEPSPIPDRMHELSLMESLVETIEERIGPAVVRVVRLEVGTLSCVVPDALRFCFDICTSGTRLEGAALDILVVPGRARCHDCGVEAAVEGPVLLCACGSAHLELLAGQELRLKELEIA